MSAITTTSALTTTATTILIIEENTVPMVLANLRLATTMAVTMVITTTIGENMVQTVITLGLGSKNLQVALTTTTYLA